MLDFLLSSKVILFLSGGVTGIWFLSWFVWPRLERLLSGNRRSAEERVAELKSAYYREQRWLEGSARPPSQAAPRVEILRTGHRADNLTCLLINRGGTATNLSVEPLGAFEARIVPVDRLDNGETGRIAILAEPSLSHPMQFHLAYDDSYGQRVVRHFAYSEPEATFKEI